MSSTGAQFNVPVIYRPDVGSTGQLPDLLEGDLEAIYGSFRNIAIDNSRASLVQGRLVGGEGMYRPHLEWAGEAPGPIWNGAEGCGARVLLHIFRWSAIGSQMALLVWDGASWCFGWGVPPHSK